MFLQTNPELVAQIVVTYILPLIGLVIMLYLAVKKWRESKNNPYNIVISLFFIGLILGIIANAFYGIFIKSDQDIAFFFARLAAFILNYALIFPLLFLIALFKGFQGISRSYKIGFFMIWAIAASPILFIGQVWLSEDFVLRWDLTLASYSFLYAIIGFSLITSYYIRLTKIFTDQTIKKRFRAFIVGYIIIVWLLIAVALVKIGIFTPWISSISVGIGLFTSPSLIYYGIGKRDKKIESSK